ncbi:hypothetical protein [uncultured Tenacibaculum sp.]|uniref:hypothetical protein n=1 Tax=uncultured Tenacibaculum sp. TaxID=174713 RepID=UPI002632CF9C|nr:hypothetical protein [uncultured Tenacibaculum sp.]
MKDFLEAIDQYLDGEMNESEKLSFENQLSQDDKLNEAFTLQQEMRLLYSDDDWVSQDLSLLKTQKAKELRNYLDSKEALKLKTTLHEIVVENRVVPKNNNLFKRISIAASVLIFITASYFFFIKNDYNNIELYTTYYSKELSVLPSTIDRNDNNNLVSKGQLYFEEKNFNEAIATLLEYQKINTTSINTLSYTFCGFSYLELNQFNKAREQFDFLKNSKTLQSKKANWYTALTYLKEDNKTELKSILENITANTTNYNYKEALDLLSKLD